MFGYLNQYEDQVYDALRSVSEAAIAEAASALADVYRRRGTLFVLCPPEDGADVDRFVHELGRDIGGGPSGFRLVELFGSPRQIVAWQNDWAYEDIYAEQMRGRIRRGDAVIAVTRRGDTANVVHALQAARALGARTIALVGAAGTAVHDVADITLRVGSEQAGQVQAAQMMLEQMLCAALQRVLAQAAERADRAAGAAPAL